MKYYENYQNVAQRHEVSKCRANSPVNLVRAGPPQTFSELKNQPTNKQFL